ncbi:CaiB/BaiF CoA transferase family protein [Candidatus Poriferisodalis sp.]|uniref:CaiB/BaiF CoA transferase family protein n=1 Tax=Candidatus Poriferisodalis sp. TaxID=3101277 RepID=UPI003B01A4F8
MSLGENEVVGAAGPLAGVRVLDLSSVLMGPAATRMLGDFGADVILVESSAGDRNRSMGSGPVDGFSGVSLNLLRNKRSISLDLKHERGRQAFLDIVATCDVMITNLRPGPLRRLGLHYEAVQQVRPDIVFCRAHGYPSASEQADAPAYDDIIQSASGIGDLFRRMGAEPMLLPSLVADKFCGLTIANSVTAALYHRALTGQGQCIEIPMIDVMRAFVLAEHGAGAISEPPVASAGYARILTPERKPQRTSDGWINILPYDQEHYVALFEAGGRHDLAADERFATPIERVTHSDSLYRDVASVLGQRTTAEWLELCEEHGIPATEAATLDELVSQLPIDEHPVAGPYRVIPPSEQFSETPPSVRRPAPGIGEHGRQILSEIGYDTEAIDGLIGDGILTTP